MPVLLSYARIYIIHEFYIINIKPFYIYYPLLMYIIYTLFM